MASNSNADTMSSVGTKPTNKDATFQHGFLEELKKRTLDVDEETWVPVGQDLDGEATGDSFGSSVTMNDNGTRVIIGGPMHGERSGHARVFEERSGEWVQIGQDINPEGFDGFFGASVAINDEGNRIIIGAPFAFLGALGAAHVFEERNGEWVQIGEVLVAEGVEDVFGMSVAMNDEGSRVIIGAPGNNGANGERSGHARAFEERNGVWVQIGEDLDGEAARNSFGISVAMNDEGNRVIIGAPDNNGPSGELSGHARAFEEINGVWVQIGEDLDGEASGDYFGGSVAMNDEGSMVIIGGPFKWVREAGKGEETGHARVFEEKNGEWVKIGQNLDGEAAYDNFGINVAMNDGGNRVIIGGPRHNGPNGEYSGHARVFELTSLPKKTGPCDDKPGTKVSIPGVLAETTCKKFINRFSEYKIPQMCAYNNATGPKKKCPGVCSGNCRCGDMPFVKFEKGKNGKKISCQKLSRKKLKKRNNICKNNKTARKQCPVSSISIRIDSL